MKFNNNYLLSLFLIIYFYFPTVFGGSETKILVLFFYCFLIVLFMSLNNLVDKRIYNLLFLSLLAAVSIVVSSGTGLMYWDDYELHFASIFRVFYFLSILLFFNIVVRNFDDRGSLVLLYTLLGCLTLQVFVVLLQAFGFSNYVGLFYTQEKMKDLDSYMRATGTFGNPNVLAIVSVTSAAIIFFINKSTLRFSGLVLTSAIILFAGSRTGLIVHSILLFGIFIYLMYSVEWYIKFVCLFCFALVFFAVLLSGSIVENNMPYLWTLIDLIDNPIRIFEVNSFHVRLINWKDKIELASSIDSIWVWFFGAGMHKSFYVLDNDYLYVFLRTGLLGVVTFYAFIFYPLLASKLGLLVRSLYGYFILLLLVIIFLWSLLFEYFSDFIMPVLLYLVFSLVSHVNNITARNIKDS